MRRPAVAWFTGFMLALTVGGAAAASVPREPNGSWATAEIQIVTAAGLLGGDAASFRPDDPLLHGELHGALLSLGGVSKRPADPSAPVTIRELDARLVAAAGLASSARRIRVSARDAGLRPRPSLGTETVARLLGFRFNHPFGTDELERGLGDVASRAEAAYSLARLISLDPTRVAWVTEAARALVLPPYGELQRAVISRAVRLVGTPYVWTGTSERPQSQLAADGVTERTVPGGFDCSGFVWRVYKLEPFQGAEALAGVLVGRTTYDMSAEVPTRGRLAFDALAPGDIAFFGRGAESKPEEIEHMGIYVGSGWMVHSSRAGVTLEPMAGWYRESFAWARRPLAEIGLPV